MTTYEAEEIIAEETGGRRTWDDHALRDVAGFALAGKEPQTSWAPGNVGGLFRAFRRISEATKSEE